MGERGALDIKPVSKSLKLGGAPQQAPQHHACAVGRGHGQCGAASMQHHGWGAARFAWLCHCSIGYRSGECTYWKLNLRAVDRDWLGLVSLGKVSVGADRDMLNDEKYHIVT
jgi:hypothetical protein